GPLAALSRLQLPKPPLAAAIPACARSAPELSAVARRPSQEIRKSSRGKLRAPAWLLGFVQTSPLLPNRAPLPFPAAIPACTDGTRGGRSPGRDWPRAAASATDGAPRREVRARPSVRQTGSRSRIPSAPRRAWRAAAVSRKPVAGTLHG